MQLTSFDVAILAGGLGTRLRSVAQEKPKVMMEVKGRPFLYHILDKLVAAIVATTVLCTGYKGDEISKVMGSRYGIMSLVYSQETTLLGTAGALRLAHPLFTSENILGKLLDESWNLKKCLSSKITNPQIEDLYARGMEAGAYGSKLAGAGGGGPAPL